MILNNYNQKGHFFFTAGEDSLKIVCNAPSDKCGIYLFYDISTDNKRLIYIGCSGYISNAGLFCVRKRGVGGIKDRIVNGHQFGIKRFDSIPLKMEKDGITRLEIEWYVTFDENVKHSPIYVESMLLQDFFNKHGKLPLWNLKF